MTAITIERKPVLEQKIKVAPIKSYWLFLGELRLDASFHSKNVSTADTLLKESGFETISLDNLSERIFYLARQKRFFAEKTIGQPYLMPSELFDFPFLPSKFVHVKKLRKAQDWYVEDGWILLTRSGKLGMPFLATSSLEKYIISDDVIRIIPKDKEYSGFLYAYLSTWLGNTFLTKNQYGVAVDHIEPHHVKSLSVPLLPEEIRKQIHLDIMRVFNLRELARDLLDKAKEMLLNELAIPKSETIIGTNPFNVGSSALNLRFDASYHDPRVQAIQNDIRKGKYTPEIIDDNIGKVFVAGRFKRIYVEEDYGVPFLSSSQITQTKPYDLKYISKRATRKIENWIIRSGSVLVTCSGTIGLVSLAPKEWDGWAVSQHVLRIVPNPERMDAGFLTAFLQTEYGYRQVVSKTYGGVVDELAEDDMKDVLVPLPPLLIQKKIGKLVIEAYELREKANSLETFVIRLLEEIIHEGARADLKSYLSTFEMIGNEKLDIVQGIMEERQGLLNSWEELKKETGLDEM